MAFCTNCGASVAGAFCNQCGTRIGSPSGPGMTPPPPQPGPPIVGMPGTVPARRKTSPIVWILVAILGIFILMGIGIVGTGFFVFHKARQAGLTPDMMARNPGYAAARIMIAANPDIEEVRHDEREGTITIRDRRTGKTSTWNFEDIKNGRFKITADDGDGKAATVEFGGAAGKLPSWVPNYPGSTSQATFTVKGDSADGSGGNYTYTTKDDASKVMSFYQDKVKALGMKVNLTSSAGEGGMMVASDEENKRTLTVVVGGSSSETTVNVTYASK